MRNQEFRWCRMGVIAVVLVLAWMTLPALAYSMQRVITLPYDEKVGEITCYHITFEPIRMVPKGGYVKITFPDGFILDPSKVGVLKTTLCDLVLESIEDNTVILSAWEPVLSRVICTIVLSNIQNPLMEGKYNIIITTTDAAGNVLDGPTYSIPFEIKRPSETAVAIASRISERVKAVDSTLSSGAAVRIALDTANIVKELLSLTKDILDALA